MYFFELGEYVAEFPVTLSSNLIPQAISKSASWIALFTENSPCIPIIPIFNGWLDGTEPLPNKVQPIGIFAISAKETMTSFVAPEIKIPCPAKP